MREILFRGKPKNEADYCLFSQTHKDNCKDGFVYGSLVISGERYFICVSALCSANSLVNNGITTMIEVIPETIGQCTGLPDKNGKKIFEGDIHQYGKLLFVVEFGAFYDAENDIDLYGFYLRDINYRNRTYLLSGDESNYFNISGNIHDNPEPPKEGVDNA